MKCKKVTKASTKKKRVKKNWNFKIKRASRIVSQRNLKKLRKMSRQSYLLKIDNSPDIQVNKPLNLIN